jgi:transposase-like protein
MNLSDMGKQRQLTTEEKCVAYLEKMRWPEGVTCPECGNRSISSFRAKGRSGKVRHLYQCLDKTCRYQFSATTGTIFHDSHLPLNKWFSAIALISDSSKPMSANQLRLVLGVQYKTATHVVGRVRQAMENGSIELDEAAAGGQAARGGKLSRELSPASKPATLKEGVLSEPVPVAPSKVAAAIDARRVETANLLSQIAAKPGSPGISSTAVDNMLSMFISLAQITVKPPLFFVNYLKDKVFT